MFTPVGYTKISGAMLEPASDKQLSALAPNLIHSLDATHLAMTALEMQNQGKSMMAVHDSYWTHASDLPDLSRILREQFVDLYTHYDPLSEIKSQWEEQFFMDLRRHGVRLPDPPERGNLDLTEVLKSDYFFS
jgi:DNA-directed RNA polymerase